MRPFGFSSRYHGSFCSRFSKSMRRTLYGSVSSSSVTDAFQPFGVAAVNNSIIVSPSNLTRHDSSAAQAAERRERQLRNAGHDEHRAERLSLLGLHINEKGICCLAN